MPSFAVASHGSPMPLRSAEKLVGEAAFAAVAPLAQAPELAVVQPFQNRLFVGIVHAGDLELAGAACGNLLGVGKAHALALGCLGPQGAQTAQGERVSLGLSGPAGGAGTRSFLR